MPTDRRKRNLAIRKDIQRSFDNWLKKDAIRFAQFAIESSYPTANPRAKPYPYAAFQLNAVLQNESSIQMRFGVWLENSLRQLGHNVFVASEVRLRLKQKDDRSRRFVVDLAVYEHDPCRPVWDSPSSGNYSRAYPREREDLLLAAIEVKGICWGRQTLYNFPGGKLGKQILKDVVTLVGCREQVARKVGRKIDLFLLILDESIASAYWRSNQTLKTGLGALRKRLQQEGIVALSNNRNLCLDGRRPR